VLTNAVAWEAILASKRGGLSESSFHNRTVPSLEAERTACEDGNATPRTYSAY
jgi:hypothetical protein